MQDQQQSNSQTEHKQQLQQLNGKCGNEDLIKYNKKVEFCSLDGGRGARTTRENRQIELQEGRKEGRELLSFTVVVVVVVESIFCRN
jgi:hypothetical protein